MSLLTCIERILTHSAVHLLGNYIYQPGLEDSDDESDYDEHDDYSDLYDDDEELEEDVEVPVGYVTLAY